MSRSTQQGKYAGKLNSKHYRTHSASVSVSTTDCLVERRMKEYRKDAKAVEEFFKDMGISFKALMGNPQ